MYVIISGDGMNPGNLTTTLRGRVPNIGDYGGRVLAENRQFGSELGDWTPEILAIQQWPDRGAFSAWRKSAEYQRWAQLHADTCDVSILVMEEA